MMFPVTPKSKLLDNIQNILSVRYYSYITEKTYVLWIRRFVFFNDVRHTLEIVENEISAFLNYLAIDEKVLST